MPSPNRPITTAFILLVILMVSCSSCSRPAPVPAPPARPISQTAAPPEPPKALAPNLQAPAPAPCDRQERQFDRAKVLAGEGEINAALAMASQVADAPCDRDRHAKALELIADIYLADDKGVNAFYFFIRAGEQAQTREDISRLLSKAAASVAHVSASDFVFLAEKTAPPRLLKELLFKAATAKAHAGNPREARILYQAFIQRFPNDAYTPAARSITRDLDQRPDTLAPAVGILLPQTGYYKDGGSRALMGINFYIQTSGRSDIRFIIMDTASDPDEAAKAVKALKTKGAACIIGPMVTARAAAEQAKALEIPMVLLSQTPGIPELSPLVFRHFLFPEQQLKTSTAFLMEKYGSSKFAVLYPIDDYGSAFASAFKTLVPDMGGQITDTFSYSPSQTDFSSQIKALVKGYRTMDKYGRFRDISFRQKKERNKIYRAKTDFQVLFIPDSPDTIAMIAPQLKYHGISDVILMGTNLWHSEKLLPAAPYLENAVFTDGFYPEKMETAEFITRFTEMTGGPPGYIEAAAYDAISSIVPLITDGETGWTLAERISRLNTRPALTCAAGFDTRGEPRWPLDIFQIKDQGITLARPCNPDALHWDQSTGTSQPSNPW